MQRVDQQPARLPLSQKPCSHEHVVWDLSMQCYHEQADFCDATTRHASFRIAHIRRKSPLERYRRPQQHLPKGHGYVHELAQHVREPTCMLQASQDQGRLALCSRQPGLPIMHYSARPRWHPAAQATIPRRARQNRQTIVRCD